MAYSPVVNWNMVSLLFVLTAAHNLRSTNIDLNSAFVQSSLPKPIYFELPPGYFNKEGKETVFKVTRSLYGNVYAAKLGFKLLQDILVQKLSLTCSVLDSCLYF
jgi:Reverse transcriptase (RNA-dependent DNA polymerase)